MMGSSGGLVGAHGDAPEFLECRLRGPGYVREDCNLSSSPCLSQKMRAAPRPRRSVLSAQGLGMAGSCDERRNEEITQAAAAIPDPNRPQITMILCRVDLES
ncbi:hypothetical protein C7U60_07265 [Mesorhizobium plurifarium]|nr:hypothetical protein C7U60_07265 [Mesorhizobium plurifarium]